MDIEYAKKGTWQAMIDKIKTLFIKKADIVDNCKSTNVNVPLSANQGKLLQDQVTEVAEQMPSVVIKTWTAADVGGGN